VILLISVSQTVRITDMHHQYWAFMVSLILGFPPHSPLLLFKNCLLFIWGCVSLDLSPSIPSTQGWRTSNAVLRRQIVLMIFSV
jgi:hypothetical protein